MIGTLALLFNSYAFVFGFLPLALIAFWGLARLRLTTLALASLTIASLAFYAVWDARYLALMGASIVFNFLMGGAITSRLARPSARWLLGLAVTINLLLLGYFKYAAFMVNNFNRLLEHPYALPEIALPLGISFFTFTQIAYLVDAYRGETKQHTFLTYGLFVTFFPHLIAGPILHHQQIIPQFHRLRTFVFSAPNVATGLALLALGLSKKLLIADHLAPIANAAFLDPFHLTAIAAWTGTLAYTLQLYFDFSGYSDMAVGLGLLFNIRLPFNFNSPYQSTSIVEFWRRWHMTLSQFLKDYLYIPLGGNRHGPARRYMALMVTMLLGGLWHGAGWTFVAWGALHGAYLVVNHLWRARGVLLPPLFAGPLTFLAVMIGWVFFRSASLADAMAMLRAMAGIGGLGGVFADFDVHPLKLAFIAILVSAVAFLPNSQDLVARLRPGLWWGLALGFVAVASLLSMNEISEFLYFQF